MADETNINEQAPVYPDYSGSSTAETPVVPVGPETPQIPIEPVSGQESPVVAVSNKNGVPKWFYFLFGITLIIFFIISALLVVTFLQKKTVLPFLPNKIETPTVVPTVQVVLPTAVPVLTFASTPAISEPVDVKMPPLTVSDEVKDINSDLVNTDLSILEKEVLELEKQIGFTSP